MKLRLYITQLCCYYHLLGCCLKPFVTFFSLFICIRLFDFTGTSKGNPGDAKCLTEILGEKNLAIYRGTKFTFLFQGKISAINYKKNPGVILAYPLKMGAEKEGKEGKKKGEDCVMNVGGVIAPGFYIYCQYPSCCLMMNIIFWPTL